MELPYGEEIMIIGRTMWTQCTSVTEGQTDGRTDGQNYDHKDRAKRRTVKKYNISVHLLTMHRAVFALNVSRFCDVVDET